MGCGWVRQSGVGWGRAGWGGVGMGCGSGWVGSGWDRVGVGAGAVGWDRIGRARSRCRSAAWGAASCLHAGERTIPEKQERAHSEIERRSETGKVIHVLDGLRE